VLHLQSACSLAPASGLEWIIDAKPRAIAEIPDLIPAIGLVVPETRFAGFAAGHGGIDVRRIEDLCIARYKAVVLSIARTPVDPSRVEHAFEARSTDPSLVTRTLIVPSPPVVRRTAEIQGEPRQLTIFGRELVALEQGPTGPLRAAEAFAQGKLRRAAPALRSAALKQTAAVLGDAPLRVFAPGPFEGAAAEGFGGLLRASTSLAASAKFAGPPARIAVRLVVTGAWGSDGPAAAERLAAATHVMTETPLGRLLGLSRPIDGPTVRATPDALILDATYDGMALARGLHDALDAEVSEIMRR
jgi:hypothetical protein